MKDAMNYFIPIVEDPMNDITGRCITVNNHISSNGYYGYQPVAIAKREEIQPNQMHPMPMETNDIQFNNFIEIEEPEPPQHRNNANRKRTWQERGAALQQYKKRRETDPLPMLIPQDQATNKCSQVRQPTHNIPDMSRCMMGHYI